MALDQGSEDYGPLDKSSLSVVSVKKKKKERKKVLLEHSHFHSFTYCPWLLSCCKIRAALLQERLDGPQSLKYFLSGPFLKKSADSGSRRSSSLPLSQTGLAPLKSSTSLTFLLASQWVLVTNEAKPENM